MQRKPWARFLLSSWLAFTLPFASWSCSSSPEDEENLETDQQATEGENANEQASQGNENAEGQQEEGNNLAELENSAEGNAGNENPGLGNDPVENDLQQIISEMNNSQETNLAGGEAPAADSGAADPSAGAEVAPPPGPEAVAEGAPAAPLASAPSGSLLPELGAKMAYIVQGGDTLGSIATKIYGSQGLWKEIASLTGLEKPGRIYPGDVVYYQLTQQSLSFAQAYESAARGEVQVQPGDSLATISKRVYGDSRLWKSIWRLNDGVSNPDRLAVGQTIYYLSDVKSNAFTGDYKRTVAFIQVPFPGTPTHHNSKDDAPVKFRATLVQPPVVTQPACDDGEQAERSASQCHEMTEMADRLPLNGVLVPLQLQSVEVRLVMVDFGKNRHGAEIEMKFT